jgi:DNA-binding NarL/FixJ family response regulator
VVSNAIIRSIAAVDNHEKMSWVDSLGRLHGEGSKTILDEFTDIQINTFRLLAQGFSNSEIAKLRFVSEKSVEQIVARIARHLRISPDRTHNMRVVLTGEYFSLIGSPRH